MSEMKDLNPNQMEEVSGGVYHGRLSPTESKLFTLFMKLAKQRGDTMEEYLKAADSLRQYHFEMTETELEEHIAAFKEYVKTFWDHV